MTIIKKKVVAAGLSKVKYVKYKEANAGDTLVCGTLVKVEPVTNFDPKKPDVPQYHFETEDGPVILNSATELNKLLAHINIGTLVEVTFLGKEKRKNKDGQTYSSYIFDVDELIDESDVA